MRHDDPTCFASHMGLWLAEPSHLQAAIAAVKAGVMPERRAWSEDGDEKREQPAPQTLRMLAANVVRDEDGNFLYSRTEDGLAVLSLDGFMMKKRSKFGGASTIAMRQALRAAADDRRVESALMHITSPGGQAAGTAEFGDEVSRFGAIKPIAAHIDDVGASAAYWAASQTGRITINRSGEAGSIGTVAVVDDTSKAYERAGIEVHVISTGPFKGSFVSGAPITDEHLAYAQDLIDQHFAIFADAVKRGRRMGEQAFQAVSDGRVFPAPRALELGLVDGISSFDEALTAAGDQARSLKQARRGQTRQARAAVEIDRERIS